MATTASRADAGTIKVAIGEVKVKGVDGVERVALVGEKVHTGEEIITGANGIVQIQLAGGRNPPVVSNSG